MPPFPRFRGSPLLLLAVSLALLSSPAAAQNAEPPQDPASGNPAQGTATIEGKIRFEGEIPRMPLIDMGMEPDCQAQSEEERRARTVRVENGVLLDVIVWVEGDAIDRYDDPAEGEGPTIDLIGCNFVPRLLGVRAGQSVTVENGDGFRH